MGRKKGGGRRRYVLYKGDEVLGVGTAEELARQQGCTPETIRFYSSPVHKRRDKGNRVVAERV